MVINREGYCLMCEFRDDKELCAKCLAKQVKIVEYVIEGEKHQVSNHFRKLWNEYKN